MIEPPEGRSIVLGEGAGGRVVAGRVLDRVYTEENLPLLRAGMANLETHITTAKRFGLPVVVAVNMFPTDTEHEVRLIRDSALDAGAVDAVPTDHWARGGRVPRRSLSPSWRHPPDDRISSSCIHWTDPSRRKSRRSPRRYTGPQMWSTPALQSARLLSSKEPASLTFRSAWRRPTSRSATTRLARVPQRVTRFPCERCVPLLEQDSSTRCSASCGPCPD